MRVLYGVVGEGMGHATRSRVVIEHLLGRGHHVHVVVSGKAHEFLHRLLDPHPRAEVTEIAGLRLVQTTEDGVGTIDKSASLWANLAAAPRSLAENLRAYADTAGGFGPDVVVSDFESWAYTYAVAHGVPVVSLDNIQVLHRCAHDPAFTQDDAFSWFVARTSTKMKLPGAWHYLVTSFFFPKVRKPRTTLVPPILRPEILAARREPGGHVVVYQHADAIPPLLPALRARRDTPFRVYGANRDEVDGHVTLRRFSQEGFVDDLRTARAVVAGGGFSLMSEAVHLGVPMLSIPLAQQAEQGLNARYLAHLSYGAWAPRLEEDVLDAFLARLPAFDAALATYPRQDNAMAMACLDELLDGIAAGRPRPDFLAHRSMGDALDVLDPDPDEPPPVEPPQRVPGGDPYRAVEARGAVVSRVRRRAGWEVPLGGVVLAATDREETEITVTLPRPAVPRFVFTRESLGSALTKLVWGELQLGDPAFDDVVVARTETPVATAALLHDREVRRFVVAVVGAGGLVSVDGPVVTVLLPDDARDPEGAPVRDADLAAFVERIWPTG